MIATTDRRMQLLDILLERRNVKIEVLVFELNASRSTIIRDIRVLSCSYPITTVTGPTGGVRMAAWYKLGMKYMTGEQVDLLERLLQELSGDDFIVMKTIIKTYSKPNTA